MAEYIERAALVEALRKYQYPYGVEFLVSCQPAADVAPVRHGRWVEKEKYTFGIMYDCSLCENRILDSGHPWNYCPNCGAKMGGGDE